MTFSDDVSFEFPSLSVADKLLKIKELIESLEKNYQTDPQKLIICNIMKQQLELLKISSQTTTALDSSNNSSPLACTTFSSPPTSASALLVRPTPFCRSTKQRVYKMKNYGVMTSDEILGKQQAIADQKGKEEEEKENRRTARVQRQEMAEKIRNMKKEKADEQRKRKADDTQDVTFQPKRRGRPPKVAKTVAADEDG